MAATIAFIAHDSKKDELMAFAKTHRALLSRYHLIATENTGIRLQQATGLEIERLLSGAQGGDLQIAAKVATGEVAAVLFFIDPLRMQPREPNPAPLLRMCAVHNVAIAFNLATAEAIAAQLRQSRIAHLIFNPVSGQGNSEEELEFIQDMLGKQMQVQVHLTSLELSAEKLARDAIAAQPDLIIASGGDGTVSAVAGALIGTDIPLGIIPRGTANAFAAAIGLPLGLTPIRNTCEVILEGHTRSMDVGLCNDKPLILLVGIGYEAETIERTDREAKRQWGPLAYIMSGWQQLSEQELFETEIEVEGSVKTFQAGAITIANAAPPTSVLAQGVGQVIFDDGLLDVTITTAESRMQAVTGMAKMFGAALVKMDANQENTAHFGAKEIKVTTHPPQKVVLDGEVIGTTPIEVKCLPNGLTVFVPPASPTNP
ncbi:MAG: methylglyoxal synthase [Spirulinaceae cyanobacterium]